MQRYGFVGRSRLDAARRVLPDALAAWYQAWCFQGEQAPVIVVTALDEPVQALIATAAWYRTDVPGSACWLCCGDASQWPALLFGRQTEHAPVDQVADYLLGEARLALMNAVLESVGQPAIAGLCRESPVLSAIGPSPRVLVTMRVGECCLSLLLDADLLDGELPRVGAESLSISRTQAVGGARVRLHVVLPLAQLPAADLTDLRVGDILKSSTALSQLFVLRTEQGESLGQGFLARRGAHLALQLADH